MKFLVSLLLIVSFYAIGCNNQDTQNKPIDSDTTTQPDKTDVDVSDSQGNIAFKVNGRPYYKKNLRHTNLEAAIQDSVLYEAAILEGKDQDPEYLNLVENYKRNILLGRFKGEIIKSYLKNNKMTDEDLKKYYEDNKERYISLDLTKISTLNKEISEKIYEALKSGKSVEDIKSEYKGNENVGVIELDMVKEYNNKFKEFKESEFTEPISENNFYNIYVIKNVDLKPYEQIKRIIAYQATNKAKIDALNEYTKKAREEKNIKVEIVNPE